MSAQGTARTHLLATIPVSIDWAIKAAKWTSAEGYSRHLSFVRDCMSIIDQLGQMYTGRSGGIVSVQFLREYMTRVNTRYGDYPRLLLKMFRHGPVHTDRPRKFLVSETKPPLEMWWWLADHDREPERSYHLHCFRNTAEPNQFKIGMNIHQLCDDLKSATDFMFKDMEKGTLSEGDLNSTLECILEKPVPIDKNNLLPPANDVPRPDQQQELLKEIEMAVSHCKKGFKPPNGDIVDLDPHLLDPWKQYQWPLP